MSAELKVAHKIRGSVNKAIKAERMNKTFWTRVSTQKSKNPLLNQDTNVGPY